MKYKETNDEILFEQFINSKEIRSYVNYVCNQKLRNSPTTLYSQDDFVNLSFLIIWQAIHKYKFICPSCKKQAKTSIAYKLHTLTKHGEYQEPFVSITRYLKFNLGAYLQNEIRREYSIERKSNIMTLSIYSPTDGISSEDASITSIDALEYDFASEELLEDDVIFEDVLNLIKKEFDDLSKEIFERLYRDQLKQRDIAIILHERGRYSSEQSAAVVVSRVIKNKINPVIAKLYPELFK